MDKQEILHRFAKNKEDEQLVSRLLDFIGQTQKGYPVYSKFLNPHERAIAKQVLQYVGVPYKMDGGHEQAERAILVCLPDQWRDVQNDKRYPLCLLRIHVNGTAFGRKLTHRDYLGSLMSLQIERETIGDILTDQDGAQIFLLRQALKVVLDELHKIGNHSIQASELKLGEFKDFVGEKKPIHVFVASMRIDIVIAEGFNLSRSKAAERVETGQVFLNYSECLRPSTEVKPQDVISLRGNGRITVGQIGGMSRKGRTSLVLWRWE